MEYISDLRNFENRCKKIVFSLLISAGLSWPAMFLFGGPDCGPSHWQSGIDGRRRGRSRLGGGMCGVAFKGAALA